jgi:2-polyprenyl-3-methyl-5-hydroxy-6-metoxy-1,4-benzoquinol methylase
MKAVSISEDWPASWRYSYDYDLKEVYGDNDNIRYTFSYHNRASVVIELIEEVLPVNSHILDVGAAQGNFTLGLAERGYHVTWNDLRRELEGYVRLKYEYGTVTFLPGNVFEIDLDGNLDCVLITEIIEHMAHPDRFLRKVATMVKPGGYVVMTTPNGAFFGNRLPRFSECSDPARYEHLQFKPDADGHIFLLWPDEMHDLAKFADLRIDKELLFTSAFAAGYLSFSSFLSARSQFGATWLDTLMKRMPESFKKRTMLHSAVRFTKI